MAAEPLIGRRYTIHGRVQGVGFRDFVQREARQRHITGSVRNADDGSVIVHAVAPVKRMAEFEPLLYRGPRSANVRRVDVEDAAATPLGDFRITH
jgi:acylphosphatase